MLSISGKADLSLKFRENVCGNSDFLPVALAVMKGRTLKWESGITYTRSCRRFSIKGTHDDLPRVRFRKPSVFFGSSTLYRRYLMI